MACGRLAASRTARAALGVALALVTSTEDAAAHGAQYTAPAGPSGPSGVPFANAPSGGAGGGTWEMWWQENQDRFLQLRTKLATDDATGQGVLTGHGRVERGGTRRAPSSQVESEVVPLLFELLAKDDKPEVLDSALIALARCAAEADADKLLAVVKPRLNSPVLSVQSSAVLALGIHGSPHFVPLLGALMSDAPQGRLAVDGNVPPLVRSLAALSLGLGNHALAVPMLTSALSELPDSQGQLKACIVTALGLGCNEGGNDSLVALFALLGQRRLPTLIAAQVPLAVARLDGGAHVEAVPPLLESFLGKDTDDRVRESVAMALGRLASFNEGPAIDALTEAARSAKHAGTRHAALMALAEIGRRDAPEAALHAAAHDKLVVLLRKQLADAPTFGDRGWCALAAGVYASGGGAQAATLRGPLLDQYAARKEPSERGSCIVALGLAGVSDAAPNLLLDFRSPGDALLRGHAAIALGLLGVHDAVPEMLASLSDKSTDPLLREQVALALALLRDPQAVPTLTDVLGRVQVYPVSLAVARALGRIGDRSAIPALAALARDKSRPDTTRGMAIVALGLLGERGDLPWNEALRELQNHEVPVDALELVADIL